VSRRFLGRCLIIGAIIVGVAAVPALIALAYVGYYLMVPRYSAVAEFEKLGFNLRLDLFLTEDELRDSGRYLTVINGGSYHMAMLAGWDWAHKARTNVYRIDEGHIAVASALGYDYRITLQPFTVTPVTPDSGDGWQYLGAFDFIFPAGRRPRLRFFDSTLAECIPMGNDDPSRWAGKPRAAARRATCPTPAP